MNSQHLNKRTNNSIKSHGSHINLPDNRKFIRIHVITERREKSIWRTNIQDNIFDKKNTHQSNREQTN